jgi:hypothetical protein
MRSSRNEIPAIFYNESTWACQDTEQQASESSQGTITNRAVRQLRPCQAFLPSPCNTLRTVFASYRDVQPSDQWKFVGTNTRLALGLKTIRKYITLNKLCCYEGLDTCRLSSVRSLQEPGHRYIQSKTGLLGKSACYSASM